MSEIMTVRAPYWLKNQLKDIAKEYGFTRNALIMKILCDWLKNLDNESKLYEEGEHGEHEDQAHDIQQRVKTQTDCG